MTIKMIPPSEISRQWLIRFQNQTHVVHSIESQEDVLSYLSQATLWPIHRLEITHCQAPFVSVRTISSLRGGKGGFGTLLKGQSRQAGARSTTNFGACRDLQGRRLRHVNDQLGYQHWKEWNDKVESGAATKEEMAKALISTPSGVAGWHLQLPAWASISKQERRKLQRQFQHFKREQATLQAKSRQQRELQEGQIQNYVDTASAASLKVSDSLQSAIQQGLRQAKRPKVEPEPPTALITLTGDIVLAYEHQWQIQNQSNFGTIGIVLQPEESNSKQSLYYEIRLVSGGLAQIGWATPAFLPNSETGDGVGDDKHSWAYDGSRSIRLHKSETQTYGPLSWNANDVVGCCYRNGIISFTLNGQDLGVAYETQKDIVVYPAVSCNPGEIVELRLDAKDMKHMPKEYIAVGDVLATEDVGFGMENEEEDAEPEKPAEKHSKEEEKPKQEPKEAPKKPAPVVVEPLDLDEYQSAEELEELGLDRLKGALMAVGVKCGGTLEERAARLFSLKGLDPKDYPKKLLAKRK